MPQRLLPAVGAIVGVVATLVTLHVTTSSAQIAGVVVVDAATGADTNPGTDAAPLRHIQTAVDRSTPGTRILVRNGVYPEGPIEIVGKNGSPTARLALGAYPGHRPILVNGFWQVVRIVNSSYVDVWGFEIAGTAATTRDFTTGVEINESHHVTVTDNFIHDMGGGGVNGIRADHVTIARNEIVNTSRWSPYQTSAISLWESQNRGGPPNPDGFTNYILANSVRDARNLTGFVTDGNCIILDHGRDNGYTGPTYIANNVCSNNGGRGIHMMRHDNVVVVNNTLAKNVTHLDQSGAELSVVGSRNIVFRNNLVNPSQPGLAVLVSDSTDVATDHNVFLGLTAAPWNGPGDRAATDVRLAFGTTAPPQNAAVDAGSPVAAPTTDINGRPRKGAPDAGALEY